MTASSAKSLLKEYLTERGLMRDDIRLTSKVVGLFMGHLVTITVSIRGYIPVVYYQDIFNFASNNGFYVEIVEDE